MGTSETHPSRLHEDEHLALGVLLRCVGCHEVRAPPWFVCAAPGAGGQHLTCGACYTASRFKHCTEASCLGLGRLLAAATLLERAVEAACPTVPVQCPHPTCPARPFPLRDAREHARECPETAAPCPLARAAGAPCDWTGRERDEVNHLRLDHGLHTVANGQAVPLAAMPDGFLMAHAGGAPNSAVATDGSTASWVHVRVAHQHGGWPWAVVGLPVGPWWTEGLRLECELGHGDQWLRGQMALGTAAVGLHVLPVPEPWAAPSARSKTTLRCWLGHTKARKRPRLSVGEEKEDSDEHGAQPTAKWPRKD